MLVAQVGWDLITCASNTYPALELSFYFLTDVAIRLRNLEFGKFLLKGKLKTQTVFQYYTLVFKPEICLFKHRITRKQLFCVTNSFKIANRTLSWEWLRILLYYLIPKPSNQVVILFAYLFTTNHRQRISTCTQWKLCLNWELWHSVCG